MTAPERIETPAEARGCCFGGCCRWGGCCSGERCYCCGQPHRGSLLEAIRNIQKEDCARGRVGTVTIAENESNERNHDGI